MTKVIRVFNLCVECMTDNNIEFKFKEGDRINIVSIEDCLSDDWFRLFIR